MDMDKKSAPFSRMVNEIAANSTSKKRDKNEVKLESLFRSYENSILGLSKGIQITKTKYYITYKVAKKTIASIVFKKTSFNIFINASVGGLEDPKSLAVDVSELGHLGVGNYRVSVESDANLDYIMGLVKQAF